MKRGVSHSLSLLPLLSFSRRKNSKGFIFLSFLSSVWRSIFFSTFFFHCTLFRPLSSQDATSRFFLRGGRYPSEILSNKHRISCWLHAVHVFSINFIVFASFEGGGGGEGELSSKLSRLLLRFFRNSLYCLRENSRLKLTVFIDATMKKNSESRNNRRNSRYHS